MSRFDPNEGQLAIARAQDERLEQSIINDQLNVIRHYAIKRSMAIPIIKLTETVLNTELSHLYMQAPFLIDPDMLCMLIDSLRALWNGLPLDQRFKGHLKGPEKAYKASVTLSSFLSMAVWKGDRKVRYVDFNEDAADSLFMNTVVVGFPLMVNAYVRTGEGADGLRKCIYTYASRQRPLLAYYEIPKDIKNVSSARIKYMQLTNHDEDRLLSDFWTAFDPIRPYAQELCKYINTHREVCGKFVGVLSPLTAGDFTEIYTASDAYIEKVETWLVATGMAIPEALMADEDVEYVESEPVRQPPTVQVVQPRFQQLYQTEAQSAQDQDEQDYQLGYNGDGGVRVKKPRPESPRYSMEPVSKKETKEERAARLARNRTRKTRHQKQVIAWESEGEPVVQLPPAEVTKPVESDWDFDM